MTLPYNALNAADELENWEEENHDILPMEPTQIVALENAGYIVDLTNGEIWRDPDTTEYAPSRFTI